MPGRTGPVSSRQMLGRRKTGDYPGIAFQHPRSEQPDVPRPERRPSSTPTWNWSSRAKQRGQATVRLPACSTYEISDGHFSALGLDGLGRDRWADGSSLLCSTGVNRGDRPKREATDRMNLAWRTATSHASCGLSLLATARRCRRDSASSPFRRTGPRRLERTFKIVIATCDDRL